MNDNPTQDELQAALTRMIEGEAEPQDEQLVAERLRSHPELRFQLRQQLQLDALLRLEAEPSSAAFVESVAARTLQSADDGDAFLERVSAALPRSRSAAGTGRSFRSSWLPWPLLAAASVALALLIGLKWLPSIHADTPWVKLTATTNARWTDTTTELSLNAGDEPSGMLRLLDGRAEFTTRSGAVVVIEAPAAMRFDAPASLYVETGKVVCRCPTPESRLTVRTAQTQVVDLGTEFAVEARGDSSTRVAVFSGEVKVASTVLKQGEGVEVRSKGVTVLSPELLAEMQRSHEAAPPVSLSLSNRLTNGQFDAAPGRDWEMPSAHVRVEDGELRISAKGHQSWPNARQTIWQSTLPGRVVSARVKARQSSEDALVDSQFAVLKLSFVGERGVEFAYASRHFQFAGDPVNAIQEAQVAAIAPPGTKGVNVQLMLNARGERHGTVIFDDAVLTIGDAAAKTVSPVR